MVPLLASVAISSLLAVLIGSHPRQETAWASSLVTVQYGGERLICDDVEQRYVVQQNKLDSRALNFYSMRPSVAVSSLSNGLSPRAPR